MEIRRVLLLLTFLVVVCTGYCPKAHEAEKKIIPIGGGQSYSDDERIDLELDGGGYVPVCAVGMYGNYVKYRTFNNIYEMEAYNSQGNYDFKVISDGPCEVNPHRKPGGYSKFGVPSHRLSALIASDSSAL
ncbi:uncharacterized protein [Anabrus simplex]|uniref:uncharacterized protein n=1 Tax=Anabrus simplex TaxID=316456 RepID=UPI0035A272CD